MFSNKLCADNRRGLLDLAGNAGETCTDWDDNRGKGRVLRGGLSVKEPPLVTAWSSVASMLSFGAATSVFGWPPPASELWGQAQTPGLARSGRWRRRSLGERCLEHGGFWSAKRREKHEARRTRRTPPRLLLLAGAVSHEGCYPKTPDAGLWLAGTAVQGV